MSGSLLGGKPYHSIFQRKVITASASSSGFVNTSGPPGYCHASFGLTVQICDRGVHSKCTPSQLVVYQGAKSLPVWLKSHTSALSTARYIMAILILEYESLVRLFETPCKYAAAGCPLFAHCLCGAVFSVDSLDIPSKEQCNSAGGNPKPSAIFTETKHPLLTED